MASSATHHHLPSNSKYPLFLLILVLIICTFHPTLACYSAIFSFGDSLADTGNLLHILGNDNLRTGKPPYGETYFGYPTGRFCDGRLVIDFMAQKMGLPLLTPYLEGRGRAGDEFRNGVNFAVAGVTAMENSFFTSRGISVPWTNISLGTQMDWFKELLPSLCSQPSDCQDLFRQSLFMVGEIGGNDYNYFFFQGRKLKEIQSLVPRVVGTISAAVEELIKLGARTLVIPGNLPIGCNPTYLTLYQRDNTELYDNITGCITWLNDFAKFSNSRLQQEISFLQRSHPEATIIYADYYEAAISFLSNPSEFGLRDNVLLSCCGGGGPYNYNASKNCGSKGANLCDNPSKYVYWDGVHMTEASNEIIASALLKGRYISIPILDTCPLDEQISSI